MKKTKIALGIEYDGSHYFGWQRQQNVPSVQGELEKILSQIANEEITLFCAGRTDAGVHATGQVVHFETTANRDLKAWTMGTNANLPHNIAVTWAKEVDDDFHARFSAKARMYRYLIYNNLLRPAILHSGLTHIHFPLDAQKMHLAAQCLVGEHDFSSFRASQCQSHSPFRCVFHVSVTRKGDYIIVEIKANAFVHHMVRNIVGSLIDIGLEHQPVDWMTYLLDIKDRTKAAATAKASGLYLVSVDYDEKYAFPKKEIDAPLCFSTN